MMTCPEDKVKAIEDRVYSLLKLYKYCENYIGSYDYNRIADFIENSAKNKRKMDIEVYHINIMKKLIEAFNQLFSEQVIDSADKDLFQKYCIETKENSAHTFRLVCIHIRNRDYKPGLAKKHFKELTRWFHRI